MEDFKSRFREEAVELINSLEEFILDAEKNPTDKTLIDEIFRVLHSLKGGGAMFGYERISEVTHNLENIFDEIRTGNADLNNDIFNLLFSAIDHLRNLLENDGNESEQLLEVHQTLFFQIETEFNNIVNKDSLEDIAKSLNLENTEDQSLSCVYFIEFIPDEEVLNFGNNPLYLLDELCDLGEHIIFPIHEFIPDIDSIDLSKCYSKWRVLLKTESSHADISDVFLFVENQAYLMVEKLGTEDVFNNEVLINFISQFDTTAFLTADVLKTKFDTSSEPDDEVKVAEKLYNFKSKTQIDSIRVKSAKLDELINIVSELVTSQASLNLFVENHNDGRLLQINEQMENITRQLRDLSFSLTLIPIDYIFTRFQRLVRDLASAFDKDIVLEFHGSDTELDKKMIELITEPIMHILRNSIDHGIESAEERLLLGKEAHGKIEISAYYSGTQVIIEIKDDGRGIDPVFIRTKAIQRNLISPDQVLSEKETLDLVFLPGFSTAQKVSEVSGRGVGMDIVKQRIAQIRGEVSLHSVKNVSTTIRLNLPITLSIIDGLLTVVDDTNYIIPLNVVAKIHPIYTSELKSAFKNIITIDQKQIPFYNLREEFDISTDEPKIVQILLVYYEDKQIGIVVDYVIGEFQAVMKPLGSFYKEQEIVSGATILGDGTVALVLDINKIINEFSFV